MSDPVIHESFLVHQRLRYLKLAVLLAAVATGLYIWHTPLGLPNGGTWLGYTLGGISAALVVWLTWFGIRKRRYASGTGKLKAYLSAHVYLGLLLVITTTLHSGFQIGWNIHTLAYALVLLTVLSGLFGIYCYARYPKLMTANRSGLTFDSMIAQIAEADQELRETAINMPEDVNDALLKAAQETRIGGGFRAQLRGDDPKCPTAAAYRLIEEKYGGQSARDPQVSKLLKLMLRKKNLLRRARRDVQIRAVLRVWLFAHIPLAVGSIAALAGHVLAVFFYW